MAAKGERIKLVQRRNGTWRASFIDMNGEERVSFFEAPDREAAKAQIPEGRFYK
jgi:hypothetical protein